MLAGAVAIAAGCFRPAPGCYLLPAGCVLAVIGLILVVQASGATSGAGERQGWRLSAWASLTIGAAGWLAFVAGTVGTHMMMIWILAGPTMLIGLGLMGAALLGARHPDTPPTVAHTAGEAVKLGLFVLGGLAFLGFSATISPGSGQPGPIPPIGLVALGAIPGVLIAAGVHARARTSMVVTALVLFAIALAVPLSLAVWLAVTGGRGFRA